MVFCPKCGAELDGIYKFCPKCGNKMPEEIGTKAYDIETPSKKEESGLLNSDNMYYLLSEKLWDYGSGDIFSEQGTKIGEMHRILISLRADIELKETNGSIIGKVRKKIIAVRPTYDIFDANNELIGQIKKTLTSVFRPALWFEDRNGKKYLKAQGNFMKWSFDVFNPEGKLVAEVRKADKWRDVFLGGIFDYKDKYGLKIYNKDIDRLSLLAFVISVDNMFHDKSGSGKNRGGSLIPKLF